MRLSKARLGDLAAPRQRQKREHVLDDLSLDLETSRANQARKSEPGCYRQTGFHHLRLGNAKLVVGSLQPPIVEQSDLHCAGCGQRLGEQLFDTRRGMSLFVLAVQLRHLLAEFGGGGGLNNSHAGIR